MEKLSSFGLSVQRAWECWGGPCSVPWEQGEQACRVYQGPWLLHDAGQATSEPYLQREGAGLQVGGSGAL